MRNQGRILLGVAIILVGLVALVTSLLEINVGFLCWPMGFILLGAWILVRVWFLDPEVDLVVRVFGPIRRGGTWQVTGQEYWLFVGDIILDFSETELPPGETLIRTLGLVGTIRMLVPEGVGVTVSSTAVVTDARVLGQKKEGILGFDPLTSEDYETAEHKIHLEAIHLVADIKVKRA